jgi:hypothetical protein
MLSGERPLPEHGEYYLDRRSLRGCEDDRETLPERAETVARRRQQKTGAAYARSSALRCPTDQGRRRRIMATANLPLEPRIPVLAIQERGGLRQAFEKFWHPGYVRPRWKPYDPTPAQLSRQEHRRRRLEAMGTMMGRSGLQEQQGRAQQVKPL